MSTTRVGPRQVAPAAPPSVLDGIPADQLRKLRPVGKRPPLGHYLADVWRHRAFIWGLATAQLRSAGGRDKLGNLWLVLSPLMNGLVYLLIFGLLLGTAKGVPNFVGYLVIGIFMFTYMSRAISQGGKSVSGNRKLVQTLAFPRAVLPLAEVLQQLVAVSVSLVAMLVIVLIAPPFEGISWRWLLILPAVALQTVFVAGLVLLFARLMAGMSDIGNLLPFALRGWLYLSGVFYAASRFDEHPTLKAVFEANPGHAFLTLVRDPVLYGRVPDLHTWTVAVAWAVPTLIIGFILFWRAEETYGRD
jgi:teichoic acid transport system permease protein